MSRPQHAELQSTDSYLGSLKLQLQGSGMLVQIKKRCNGGRRSEYATHSDFCAIFTEQLERLYLLGLILTGDQPTAEQCFLATFEMCAEGSPVFKHSASSWSRRSVIKNAIRIASPAPSVESLPDSTGNHSQLNSVSVASLKGVQELPSFERFVFVISVLERYSDAECSALLNCAVTDILPARIRAMQQLSMRDEKDRPSAPAGDHFKVDADWLECG
jgi:DNA-directed RNA polymerase specialized sigma24 family protein